MKLINLIPLLIAAPFLLFAGEPQPIPTPEEELRTFEVCEGFEVNLFASDPQMAKPINMNFDPQGRLWVASSETYPQVKPGEVPNDKIIVLEDTTGSGRADKATVFADHLFIPTGIVPGDGGAYVANSTQIIHFRDTNGDLKADEKRILLDGFGSEDTHHIIHTFRWGVDGRLYFNQSVYIHTHMETPYGVKRHNAGGTWRFNTLTQEAEVITHGMVNHWGHAITKWGEQLMTDGAYGEGVNFTFPGSTFFWASDLKQRPPARILKGMSTGQPKYAGLEIISGRHFPDDWQGDVITNDFRASRIVRFKLTEQGSGFTAKLMPDVIHVKNAKGSGNGYERAFRPIDVKMGPDGAIYIADWFNPIIQHGEVDFRDPRRDHVHGRIWRLTAKGRPLVERPKLAGLSASDLFQKTLEPEEYTRAQARRLLIEMGAEKVLPQITGSPLIIRGAGEKKSPYTRSDVELQSLWLHQAFNAPDADLLHSLLGATEPHFRAAATRVLRDWHKSIPNALDLLSKLIDDESPRVRLEAIVALEQIPDRRAIETALRALNKPTDANIDYALFHACNALKDQWLPGVENGSYSFNGDVRAVGFALQAVGSKAGVAALLKLLKDGKIPAESQEGAINLIAGLGGEAELTDLSKFQDGANVTVLCALERAVRERKAKVNIDAGQLKKAVESTDAKSSAAAMRLAGALKLSDFRAHFTGVLDSEGKSPDESRIPALDALVALDGAKAVPKLESLAQSQRGAALRARALAHLVAVKPAAAVAPAAALLATDIDSTAAAEVFAAFAKKQGAGAPLAAALAGKLSAKNAEAGLRYFNASGQSEPELLKLLKSIVEKSTVADAASPNLPGKKPAELVAANDANETKALVAEVLAKGDAARGEKIFRRKTLSCLSCHAIGGAGGQVGPDLSSVGAASQLDYLADAILFPNKTVKEGYNSVTVWTKDEEMILGNVVRQTTTHLILRDGTRDEIPIPVPEIAKKRESGSLMPNGLADSLTRGELVDLLRFISELGKPGAYSTAQSTAIRRYRILDTVPADLMFENPDKAFAAFSQRQDLLWLPAFAEVSGTLPLPDVLTAENRGIAFVRFELDVSTAGAAKFRLTAPPNGQFKGWVNNTAFDPASGTIDLPKGLCTVTLRVDYHTRPPAGGGLKIEVDEAPGSPGKFGRVGGK